MVHFIPLSRTHFWVHALVYSCFGILSGCTAETVYTHVQQEDGLAMKAPINFTVRIRIDTQNKVITWMQDLEDAVGVKDRQIRTYGGFPGSNCDVFDDSNWKCEVHGTDGKLFEQPEMKEGVLSRFYWTQTVKYKRHWRIFNHNF